MGLSDTARDRLEDVRELQPTSNGELEEQWGMDTGREVHQYLEAELGEYVYRGDDVRIRLSEDAAQVVATDAEGDVDGRIAVENAGETP